MKYVQSNKLIENQDLYKAPGIYIGVIPQVSTNNFNTYLKLDQFSKVNLFYQII
jgi:hypothetical protein